jgi:hypothetical protein
LPSTSTSVSKYRLQKEDQLRPDCGIVDPIPDNFDNNIREPFLNTLISNIQSRFEDADIIDQLAILESECLKKAL